MEPLRTSVCVRGADMLDCLQKKRNKQPDGSQMKSEALERAD